MTANIPFNYLPQTNAQGSFNITSYGLIQGTAYDSPNARYNLAGGTLATTETIPMWGGVGISEAISGLASQPIVNLGGYITRATTVTANAVGTLTGFSVFDQNYSAVNSPQSPVPLVPSGGQVNYYRLGSGARIAVACAAGLISLQGGVITQQVSWDFTSQQLVAYSAAYNNVTISNAVWASTAGGQTTFTVGTNLTSILAAGDTVDVSGVVNTGGAVTNAFNGSWVVVSVGASSVVVTQPATVSPGTYASGGTLDAAGGALNVDVLEVSASNNMTVQYDPVTGYATWNRNGAAAVILI